MEGEGRICAKANASNLVLGGGNGVCFSLWHHSIIEVGLITSLTQCPLDM